MNDLLSRREFLEKSGRGVAAGLTAAALLKLGESAARAEESPSAPGKSTVAPSDKVLLGFVGTGGRGRYLMGLFKTHPDVEIAAVSDLNSRNLEAAIQVSEGKAKGYHDYRELLARKDIDAVVVATNGHWHALPAIHACQAGKDIYVEKPLALTIQEGRAVVKAARKYNRIACIGTQQRSSPHYQKAVEIIQSGLLGKIGFVEVWDVDQQMPGFGNPPDGEPLKELDWDFWLGPSPKVPFNINRYYYHYWFWDYGGGWQSDWAVHHNDIVHWAMGCQKPVGAQAMGGKLMMEDNRELPDTFSGVVEYPSFIMSYRFTGANSFIYENRWNAKIFHGNNGSMILNRGGYAIISESIGGKKVIEEVRVGGVEGDGLHQPAFIEAVKSRKEPPNEIEIGHYSSVPGHLLNISYRVGRRIKWDAEKEVIPNDAAANRLVGRRYRRPWRLPA
jgi:predicted dehydrogenase